MTPEQQQIGQLIAMLEARNLEADANVKASKIGLQDAQAFKTMRDAMQPPPPPPTPVNGRPSGN